MLSIFFMQKVEFFRRMSFPLLLCDASLESLEKGGKFLLFDF